MGTAVTPAARRLLAAFPLCMGPAFPRPSYLRNFVFFRLVRQPRPASSIRMHGCETEAIIVYRAPGMDISARTPRRVGPETW